MSKLQRIVVFVIVALGTSQWSDARRWPAHSECLEPYINNASQAIPEYRRSWKRLFHRYRTGKKPSQPDGCHLRDIKKGMLSIHNNAARNICQGIAISKDFGLTATRCFMPKGNTCPNHRNIKATGEWMNETKATPLFHSYYRQDNRSRQVRFNLGVLKFTEHVNRFSFPCMMPGVRKFLRIRNTPPHCRIISNLYDIDVNVTLLPLHVNSCRVTKSDGYQFTEPEKKIIPGCPVICKIGSDVSENKWALVGIVSSQSLYYHAIYASLINRHNFRSSAACQCS